MRTGGPRRLYDAAPATGAAARQEKPAMKDWKFELVPAPAPGMRAEGSVDWGDPVVTGWDWPYVAVHGAAPGPAVLITAGIHGSEYASIDAVVRLGAALDPASVKGQVLCLPVLNPGAFWERAAYVSPVDNLNLNRVFPGKPKGTFTERLAHILVEKAMRHADAYIDMHGGDLPEALVPFNLWYQTGNAEVDDRSRAMAEVFGAPLVLAQRAADSPVSGLAYATAATLGVPAMLAEDGGAGTYEAEIGLRMLAGLQNVLRTLEVIPGAVRNVPPPQRLARFNWVRTEHAGFFRARVRVGEEVAGGQSLGALVDFHDRELEDVTAPEAGRILFLIVSPAIGKGGLVCGLGIEAAD
jgi:predicted deacylase